MLVRPAPIISPPAAPPPSRRLPGLRMPRAGSTGPSPLPTWLHDACTARPDHFTTRRFPAAPRRFPPPSWPTHAQGRLDTSLPAAHLAPRCLYRPPRSFRHPSLPCRFPPPSWPTNTQARLDRSLPTAHLAPRCLYGPPRSFHHPSLPCRSPPLPAAFLAYARPGQARHVPPRCPPGSTMLVPPAPIISPPVASLPLPATFLAYEHPGQARHVPPPCLVLPTWLHDACTTPTDHFATRRFPAASRRIPGLCTPRAGSTQGPPVVWCCPLGPTMPVRPPLEHFTPTASPLHSPRFPLHSQPTHTMGRLHTMPPAPSYHLQPTYTASRTFFCIIPSFSMSESPSYRWGWFYLSSPLGF
ncbi:hypothetical protein C8F04DRAFT_1265329 [Mycena alexandri]|uniref:Uncharacterized protein n=1 Tax=Mycena alexandri TaxID=1745969 RepID=A0AAD6X1S5_9AGAR|nr:hypothetical protein C8F04DRAFT_1265329 [Mycena alexandri]